MILSDFHSIRPPFETDQATGLEWLLDAHTESERHKGLSDQELATFREALRETLWRVGCKPDRIEKRGHFLPDFLHRDWDAMEVYSLKQDPKGKDLSVRMRHYEESVDLIFEAYYGEETQAPDDLIHVSCTGYISPSGAQKIVSKRNWGHLTTVTHAYHMGCYGSIPAIRMALGFRGKTDIVHTEVCTLHSNPSNHKIDQLVSQSLFADGFIKYSVTEETKGVHFKVLAIHEEILPDSLKAMTWNVVEWGYQMTLSKEIPVLIARHLKTYLTRLAEKGGSSVEELVQNALFAVHPGGPKILLRIQDLLGLKEEQLTYSFQILRECGNMSSATLPHIWEAIAKDEKIETGRKVVALAFGPGLSICGLILEKRCGS